MSNNSNQGLKMAHQIKVKFQAPILSIKMVQLRPLLLDQPLLVQEVEGELVAQPWEVMNGVGRERIIMLIFFHLFSFREYMADQDNRKKLNVAVGEILTKVSTSWDA